MLLFRPARGGIVSRQKLEARLRSFEDGHWIELLSESADCAEKAHSQSVRRRRHQHHDDDAKRATSALSLVQVGKLSAARQALEGASMAPGTIATLRALTDPDRRPPVPREEMSRGVAEAQHAERFQVASEEFLICVRKARRGAAAGPSGMTSDHLFPVLESEIVSDLLTQVASLLAVGQVPGEILEAIRLGRLTALSKARWRGEGDRRGRHPPEVGGSDNREASLENRPKRPQLPSSTPCQPKQGVECVAHILQTLTDLDLEATVVSTDGVGAYDLISRNAMLEGLLRNEGGDQILPFVRCFCGSPSTYLWEDEMGVTQHFPQGEGSKATPSCQYSSHWDNTERWKPHQARLGRGEHVRWFSMMTSTQ